MTVIITTIAGYFTHLHATLDAVCLQEDIILSCATSHYTITWHIELRDQTAPQISRLFRSTDSVGKTFSIATNELQLYFKLLSNTMGVLNSTLAIHTTRALANTSIKCEGTTTRRYVLKIASLSQKVLYL